MPRGSHLDQFPEPLASADESTSVSLWMAYRDLRGVHDETDFAAARVIVAALQQFYPLSEIVLLIFDARTRFIDHSVTLPVRTQQGGDPILVSLSEAPTADVPTTRVEVAVPYPGGYLPVLCLSYFSEQGCNMKSPQIDIYVSLADAAGGLARELFQQGGLSYL